MLKLANLALLIVFPVAWFAPLLRAGIDLPLFGTEEISVISGLQSLWETDVALALLVTFLAVFAPYLKTIGLALIHFGQLRRRPGGSVAGQAAPFGGSLAAPGGQYREPQVGYSSSMSLPSASSASGLSFSSNSSPAVVLASTTICSTSDSG